MNKLYKFVAMVTSLALVHSVTLAGPGLTPNEIAEVKKFTSLEIGKGNLLTPPFGNVTTDSARLNLNARDYVNKIVQELAGPQLAERGVHYVINIYGNPNMNAWVQQFSPISESGVEATWKKENPGQIWPLRKAWGIPDDGKPIFELGVTTELLKRLETKDELAFIMGHELTHLLEGHTDHSSDDKEAFKSWWSSQAHEVTADHMAILLMLGKYELDAALTVMEKLHPKSDKIMNTRQALNAGASTHHAEGVRISALQYVIEYFRRYNEDAAPRPTTELPKELKLQTVGREEKPKFEGNVEDIEKYLTWVQKAVQSNEAVLDSSINIFKKYRADELTYANVMKQVLQKIDSTDGSKKQKVLIYLKSMIFIGGQFTHQSWKANWFVGWSSADRLSLTQFLVKNSSGNDGWTVLDYQKMMADMPTESRHCIEVPFMSSLFGQSILAKLIKMSSTWQSTFEYWTSLSSFIRDGSFEAKAFRDVLTRNDNDGYPESSLRDQYREKLPRELLDFRDSSILLAKLEGTGLPEFWHLNEFTTDRFKRDPNLRAAVKAAIKPHLDLLKQKLLDSMIQFLSSNAQAKGLDGSFREALPQLFKFNLDLEEKLRLANAYETRIETGLNLTYNEGKKYRHTLESSEIELVTILIKNNSSDRPKILNYFRYILMHASPEINSPITLKLSEAARAILSSLYSSLNPFEILYVTQTKSPAEIEVLQKFNTVVKETGAVDRDSFTSKIIRRVPRNFQPIQDMMNWDPYLKINWKVHKAFLQMATELSESHPIYGAAIKKTLAMVDLNTVLSDLETAMIPNKFSGPDMSGFPQGAAKMLFKMFFQSKNSFSDLNSFYQSYNRILKIAGPGLTLSPQEESFVRNFLQEKIKALRLTDQADWLQIENVRKAIGDEFLGQQLAAYIRFTAGKAQLKFEIQRILKLIPLREKHPDAFNVLRNALLEKYNIQPHELETVFPNDSRTTTEKIGVAGHMIRGMSAFSTYTRGLSHQEQIEMIEFIMSRSEKMPKSLAENDNSATKETVDIKMVMLKLKEEMKLRTVLERSMLLNTVLTGPNAMIATQEGLDRIHAHLLKSVTSENKEFATILLNGLAAAEGRNKSLFLSYALAQQSNGQNLSESSILRSLLDAYGVPTVKLAQYLAFTNEFKSFQAALESYQDAAMPINYYEALVLLQKRFGAKWDPSFYRIVKILGSGSVNIAIEYEDLQTGETNVFSVGRDEIEVKTKEDFRRFHLLIKELTKTVELRKKFGFVMGLMKIIEKSVSLEFDKVHAFKMQKSVQKLYAKEVDGWKITTVDAFSIEGMTILMQKAHGVGARSLLKSAPAVYESAMRAFMKVEYQILRGVDQSGNPEPVQLIANPDMHDGQIVIDVENKTVTVLDFGQGLIISNSEREFALDILRIISKAESAESTYELLQKYEPLMAGKFKLFKNFNVIEKKIPQIINRGDRMDVFVHLLSQLSQVGYEVPLATVHWVLAANRLIKLGQKVRLSPESSIKWMLAMRKIGLSLKTFNELKSLKENSKDYIYKTVIKPTQPINSCSKLF